MDGTGYDSTVGGWEQLLAAVRDEHLPKFGMKPRGVRKGSSSRPEQTPSPEAMGPERMK